MPHANVFTCHSASARHMSYACHISSARHMPSARHISSNRHISSARRMPSARDMPSARRIPSARHIPSACHMPSTLTLLSKAIGNIKSTCLSKCSIYYSPRTAKNSCLLIVSFSRSVCANFSSLSLCSRSICVASSFAFKIKSLIS